jgi:ACS family hexuronate transporter-like MFS transporter
VIYGAAIYLSQVMGRSQADIGKVLWIPPVGWEAGYFFWGTISDRLAATGRLNLHSFRSLLLILAALSLPWQHRLPGSELPPPGPRELALL